jgi:acyl-CoA thioester hydrolase
VSHVYTAGVTVRHDELDRFGRAHPGSYLRYLAHAAVEASAAAGYHPEWYDRAGTMWLVRRTTFELTQPVTLGDRLAISTWVEDFRRVRSHRRSEVRGADGELRLGALTDWVYIDVASGRPRRVPDEMAGAFGVAPGTTREREAWRAPEPPPGAAATVHRVPVYQVDSIGHVNNAVYLDLLAQATHDALADVGWPLDRLIAEATVPVLAAADLEYLDGARYGDDLVLTTWFAPTAVPSDALDAYQLVGTREAQRPLVRAATRWRFAAPTGAAVPLPAALLTALRSLLAA